MIAELLPWLIFAGGLFVLMLPGLLEPQTGWTDCRPLVRC